MSLRFLLALPPLAVLAACGAPPPGQEFAATNRARAAETDAPAAEPEVLKDDLPRELAMTAQMLSKQLPLRQEIAQGVVSVTGVEARGTELIHTVEYPTDLNQPVFDQLKAKLPERLCGDMQLRQLVERGGSQTYVMRDKDGEEFRATVDRC